MPIKGEKSLKIKFFCLKHRFRNAFLLLIKQTTEIDTVILHNQRLQIIWADNIKININIIMRENSSSRYLSCLLSCVSLCCYWVNIGQMLTHWLL